MSIAKSIIIFFVGVLTGSFVTRYAYDKQKEEDKEMNEDDQNYTPETNKVISVPCYADKPTDDLKKNEEEDSIEDVNNYIIQKYGYRPSAKPPYVIPPDEFGALSDYAKVSYTYYSDGVLTDDEDDIIENVNECVGEDFVKHFGEYEEDSVYIRNEKQKTDYEILYSLKSIYWDDNDEI